MSKKEKTPSPSILISCQNALRGFWHQGLYNLVRRRSGQAGLIIIGFLVLLLFSPPNCLRTIPSKCSLARKMSADARHLVSMLPIACHPGPSSVHSNAILKRLSITWVSMAMCVIYTAVCCGGLVSRCV